MNLLRLLAISAVSVSLVGCGTTDSTSSRSQTRAKTSQLRVGMSQSQVTRIFGQPTDVDHDDGGYHGYRPYYGYGYGWRDRGGEELEWEYDQYDLKVKFRRTSSGGWVVKEWDAD